MINKTLDYTTSQRMTLATRKVELGKQLDEKDEEAIQTALMQSFEGVNEHGEQEMETVKVVINLFRQIDDIKESLTNNKLIPLVRGATKNTLVNGGNGENPELVNQHYTTLITEFQKKYHQLSDAARELVLAIIPIDKVKRIFN